MAGNSDGANKPASKGAPPAPRPRRSDSRMAVIVGVAIVIGVAIAAASSSISSFMHLQRWSQAGPRGAAAKLQAALDAGDAEALKAAMYDPEAVMVGPDGSVTLRTGYGPAAATVATDRLRLGGSAQTPEIEYKTQATPGKPALARMTMPLANEDGDIMLSIIPTPDGWKIWSLRIRGGVMREIRGPDSPLAQKQGMKAQSEEQ